MEYNNGSIAIFSSMPFQQLLKVQNCPCPDGRRRVARIAGQPNTAFSIPAVVKVSSVSVSGFVTMSDEGFIFRHNEFGKNAWVFDNPGTKSIQANYR